MTLTAAPLLAQGLTAAHPRAGASLTDVSVELPSLGEVLDHLLLRAGYNTTVVTLGVTLLGLAAGVVGTFALLRKRSLVADAISHATLPGVCAAFMIAVAFGGSGKSLAALLLGASATAGIALLLIQAIVRHTRLKEDAAIGAVLSVSFAIGIVLQSVIQGMRTGTQGGLNHFIYGQTAAMGERDIALMAGIALVSCGAAVLLFKELTVLCFDDQYARIAGLPAGALDLGLMTLVALVVVSGLQAVGLILVVAMLIIPAAAARFWTDRAAVMTPLAGVIGAASGYFGAIASALLPRLAAGAIIVLVASAAFAISMLAAPRRGIVAGAARRSAMALRMARDHALRVLYEAHEATVSAGSGVPIEPLAAARGWSPLRARVVMKWLSAKGLIEREDGRVRLTADGYGRALRVTRNHRLWERYLLQYAAVAPSHVDFSADFVEHSLSPEIVRELESLLAVEGRLPSPHPIVLAAESLA